MTEGTLRRRAERAFKWSAVTTVARFGLQLVAQVLLARLLGPDNYGVYGIGMVVLTFATFLSGNSFSYILMLKKDVSRDDVRFAFTWQLLAGIASGVVMFLCADWLAGFFGNPGVAPMVQWMSIACVLISLGSPATCLLQRDLNFRAVGLIQLASYGAGYLAVGVPMALAGYGALSLAAACLVQAAVVAGASFAARPHSVRPLYVHPLGADTLETGRTVFVTNIVHWLLGNLDRIVIGRMLNAQAVGLFNVAYNIASIPNSLLVSAMQPTFLAAGAKLQGQPKQLAAAWMTVLASVFVFLVPLALVMALLSPDLVRLLYGPAWSQAGWVMALLFLCVPAWACLGLSTPVLWNTGRKHLEVRLQLPLLALVVPCWWLAAPYGIQAIAGVSAALVVARAVVIVAAGLRAVDGSAAPVWRYLGRGLGIATPAALAVLAGQQLVAPLDSAAASLVAGGTLGGLAVLVLVAWRPQVLGAEAHGVLSRFIPAVGPRWPAATPPEVRP